MLNKLPLLIIVLIIIFLITSLITFITMEKVVTPEKKEIQQPQGSTAGAVVKISIVNQEKEAVDSGTDIK